MNTATATIPELRFSECVSDPDLLGPAWTTPETKRAWSAVHRCLDGQPLDDSETFEWPAADFDSPPRLTTELDLAIECTGGQITRGQSHVGKPYREAYLIIGRRGGKSANAAVSLAHRSGFRDYSGPYQQLGEILRFMCLSPRTDQARVILRYVEAIYRLPALRPYVTETTREGKIIVNNAINIRNFSGNELEIAIQAASLSAVRGFTVPVAVLDELAFFFREVTAANPDTEIAAAIRPGLITIPHALLIGISSAYTKTGLLYEQYDRHFGKPDSRRLIWQAPSWVTNPTLVATAEARQLLADERTADPASFRAEYGAQFRDDITQYVTWDVINPLIAEGRTELPYAAGNRYFAFADPSGGRGDAFTLGIAHVEGSRIIEDINLSDDGSDLNRIVEDYCQVLKTYRISRVIGDNYAAEWPVRSFSNHGVLYERSKLNRSQLYIEQLPLLTTGSVELLDRHDLNVQTVSLERKAGRNHDTIDHPRRGHDDMANSRAGCLVAAAGLAVVADRPTVEPKFANPRLCAGLRSY